MWDVPSTRPPAGTTGPFPLSLRSPWLSAFLIPVSLKGKHSTEPGNLGELSACQRLLGHLGRASGPFEFPFHVGHFGEGGLAGGPVGGRGHFGDSWFSRETGLASGLWCKARVGDNKIKILEFGDRPEPWREKEGQTQSRVMTWVMRVGREERRTMRHQGR